jgi:serine/threonine protein kinase
MLADFGISRVMMTAAITTTRSTVGTAYWTAPELFIEDIPTPMHESDIWAFGCICYEVIFIFNLLIMNLIAIR